MGYVRFKRIFAALLSGAFLLVSGLCTAAGAKVTVSVYHRGLVKEVEWVQALESSFERENADIDVKLIQGPADGGAPYFEKLALLWSAGQAPDVFYGAADKASMIKNGWARDLTSFIEKDKDELALKDFLPGSWELWKRSGKQMGIPITVLGQGVFYNRDLLDEVGLIDPPISWDEPGWTWEDMVSYGKKLTRVAANGRIERFGISQWGNGDWTKRPGITWLFGGDWFAKEAYETGIPRGISLSTPANIRAYQALVDLHFRYRICPGPTLAWAQPGSFVSGKIGMEIAGWWAPSTSYIPQKVDFRWGVAPFPKVASRVDTVFSDPLFISSVARHPEAAWRFVKYATGPKGMELYAKIVAFPPTRKSAMESYLTTIAKVSGMKEGEVFSSFVGSLEHGRGCEDHVIANWAAIMSFVGKQLEPMFSGTKDVETTLAAAETATNGFLETFQKK